jgi:uncharacterized protein YodC (DUF2158 family)
LTGKVNAGPTVQTAAAPRGAAATFIEEDFMAKQWKEGDIVQLRSGGPKMIVDRLVHYSDDSTSVYCVWFDGGSKRECDFPPDGLEKCTERDAG